MTNIVGPRGRPLRADARRNRERILDSASAVFSERGTEAQIDDVARSAGVGVGTVYRHFPTKEALMTELVRQKFSRLSARTRDALDLGGEPFEALVDLLHGHAEELHCDAAMQQVLAGADAEMWSQAELERQELVSLIGELIDRARRAGTIRADATAFDVGMLMCGLCATMAHPSPGFDWRRHLELIVDALRP